MKITGDGQVRIPTRLSKKHGLKPGTNVELIDQPNGVLIIKAPTPSKGQQVVDLLMRGGAVKGRTQDWLRLTRGDE
jgi:bifunctional DNA-binding transcriptional regulator/antitoxin component of YhaV-PrlF toxin-antitoxin module